ncbi:MAG: Autotransporter [Labilithrix sp.]|nr:Autotransporter [Labilithrix sp.]
MGASILRGGGVAAVLVVALAPSARADPLETTGPRFHLAYAAPGGCPDRAAFLSALHARTKRARLAADGETAIDLSIAIETGPESVIGHLEVREPGGSHQRRSLSNDRCIDVVEGLALVVALLLDPDAGLGDLPALSPVQPEAGPPAPVAASTTTTTGRSAPPEQRERSTPPPRPFALAVGGELGAMGGVAPVLAPVAGAFVDLDTAPGRSGMAPSFRLGLDFAAASSDAPAGRQSYGWLGATARGCPVRVMLAPSLSAAPCAAFAIGAHHATTSGVPSPTASTTPWIAAVAGANLQWAVTPALVVELQGGAVFPILRRRFFLADPDTTIFEVPVASGTGSVTGRWRFW